MALFHMLRSSRWLPRAALLWFALTLCAAVASPVLHPQGEQVICSGMGMQKVLINEDGTTTTSAVSGISCPLCLVGGAPPVASTPLVAAVQMHGNILPSAPAAHIDSFTARPPQARGPPPL